MSLRLIEILQTTSTITKARAPHSVNKEPAWECFLPLKLLLCANKKNNFYFFLQVKDRNDFQCLDEAGGPVT